MESFDFWGTEITYLKKVGPKRATALLKECRIKTFGDLLHYFPRKYVDKSKVSKVRDVRPGKHHYSLIGKLGPMKLVKSGKTNRLVGSFYDGSGLIELVWFKGVNWIKQRLKPGMEVALFGQIKGFSNKLSIAHPEIDVLSDGHEAMNTLAIIPYYHGTEGLKRAGIDSRNIREMVHGLLDIGQRELKEFFPDFIIKKYKLPGHRESYLGIHFPQNYKWLELARYRLKFEEFFFFQLMLSHKRAVRQQRLKSNPFPIIGELFNRFFREFIPFELTGAQKRVLKEVRRDLAQSFQMNRLVQGDVGCGKTMVAFMCCLIALDNGYQAALMAPTEILAGQHYRNFKEYGDALGVEIGLIVGGQKKKERRELLEKVASGEIKILIGTHAIIEDPVVFDNLGLSIVDEQHKFGVLQRARLWKKGKNFPHNMVMTATPIPRTLGMTLYGDLEISIIDELPPGRTPPKTLLFGESRRLEVFGHIRRELEKGHQAYIVYPLVEESAKSDLLAVTEGYEAIQRAFPNFRVGIVHGRQKSANKEMEMARFKKAEFQILVSTTVIEVGVDVPNATVMLIENAERFGLSQLHQLRGRIGRGGNDSICLLMASKKVSDHGKKRLKAMEETSDGFKISEIDLRLRGPGDFLGTRQSGLPEFKLANIVEDGQILEYARTAAMEINEFDPHLSSEELKPLKIFYQKYLRDNSTAFGLA